MAKEKYTPNDVEKLIYKFIHDATQVILQSRCMVGHASSRRGGKWFSLNILEAADVSQGVKEWAKNGLFQPLVIEISTVERARSVLIERWVIQYRRENTAVPLSHYKKVHKMLTIFMRTLVSTTRNLPAYALFRSARDNIGTGSAPPLAYNLSDSVGVYLPDDAHEQAFAPVVVPFGVLSVGVAYKTRYESGVAALPGSLMTDDIDEDFFNTAGRRQRGTTDPAVPATTTTTTPTATQSGDKRSVDANTNLVAGLQRPLRTQSVSVGTGRRPPLLHTTSQGGHLGGVKDRIASEPATDVGIVSGSDTAAGGLTDTTRVAGVKRTVTHTNSDGVPIPATHARTGEPASTPTNQRRLSGGGGVPRYNERGEMVKVSAHSRQGGTSAPAIISPAAAAAQNGSFPSVTATNVSSTRPPPHTTTTSNNNKSDSGGGGIVVVSRDIPSSRLSNRRNTAGYPRKSGLTTILQQHSESGGGGSNNAPRGGGGSGASASVSASEGGEDGGNITITGQTPTDSGLSFTRVPVGPDRSSGRSAPRPIPSSHVTVGSPSDSSWPPRNVDTAPLGTTPPFSSSATVSSSYRGLTLSATPPLTTMQGRGGAHSHSAGAADSFTFTVSPFKREESEPSTPAEPESPRLMTSSIAAAPFGSNIGRTRSTSFGFQPRTPPTALGFAMTTHDHGDGGATTATSSGRTPSAAPVTASGSQQGGSGSSNNVTCDPYDDDREIGRFVEELRRAPELSVFGGGGGGDMHKSVAELSGRLSEYRSLSQDFTSLLNASDSEAPERPSYIVPTRDQPFETLPTPAPQTPHPQQ